MLLIDVPPAFVAQQLLIQNLQEDDVARVMLIEQSAHSHPWSESIMRDSLKRHCCRGLFLDQVLVGFAVFSLVLDEAELLDFVISPDQQGKKLGRCFLESLLESMTSKAQRIFLEVRASNHSAIALYDACGFVEVGIRKGYYPTKNGKEDAVIMALEVGFNPFS